MSNPNHSPQIAHCTVAACCSTLQHVVFAHFRWIRGDDPALRATVLPACIPRSSAATTAGVRVHQRDTDGPSTPTAFCPGEGTFRSSSGQTQRAIPVRQFAPRVQRLIHRACSRKLAHPMDARLGAAPAGGSKRQISQEKCPAIASRRISWAKSTSAKNT